MSYSVVPVSDKRRLGEFLRLPFALYRGDPLWVPPLVAEVRRTLDPERNPYFAEAALRLFVCYRDSLPVARLAVVISGAHREAFGVRAAFFGFFEAANDEQAVEHLFAEAETFCRTRNAEVLEGPFNPHHYSEIGLKIDRFGTAPSFFQPHNPPCYPELLEKAGYRISARLQTMANDDAGNDLARRFGDLAVATCRDGYTVRSFSLADKARDLAFMREVNNDAFAGNWHFLPLSPEEYMFSAKFMSFVTRPDLVKFVEYDGRPVAVLHCVLDVNPLLRTLERRGRTCQALPVPPRPESRQDHHSLHGGHQEGTPALVCLPAAPGRVLPDGPAVRAGRNNLDVGRQQVRHQVGHELGHAAGQTFRRLCQGARPMTGTLEPQNWGLETAADGRLTIGTVSAVDIARTFGTPLHVLHEERLETTAAGFRRSMETAYPGRSSVHYAFKCNSVPAVIEAVRRAGLKAEVMSPLELELALHLGYGGEDIVVNGPGKTAAFLKTAVESAVRLINVDSLHELALLNEIAGAAHKRVDILLRVNPDLVPKGMNAGSATGSRKGCAFGLDLRGGEVREALGLLRDLPGIRFRGFHFHIGTGIRDARAYSRVLDRLAPLFRDTRAAGFRVDVVDVGGGFAARTTREMSSRELLIYQGFGRLPAGAARAACSTFEDFSWEIGRALRRVFPAEELPELITEPGRSVVSPNQFLLLTVSQVKARPRVRKWLITDGGLGTVTLPTFYECHEVLLADDVRRPRTECVTIVGPVCFASDVVYRNIRMPEVRAGEVVAVMDSGAYFLALESSFGFPRPAVVAVKGDTCRLVRRRETFADLTGRDIFSSPNADSGGRS